MTSIKQEEVVMKILAYTIITLCAASQLIAEPQLSSWNIGDSGRYARLFETSADETTLNFVTTWSNGAGTQNTPTYAGVHEVAYSDDWVYIRTTGLGQHIMGPWYLNEADTQLFPNYPANNAARYRIPRTPQAPPASTVLTGLGAIGYFVDGVAMFDSRDAFSYSTANTTDATPINGVTGDGVWNRDAYVNESVTFDAANAHQAGIQYHYHANPPALRYLLGGHVEYDNLNNTYSEKSGTPTQHSPLIGWVDDGHPLYGPYGYSDATNAYSTVQRMVSGYQTRNISVRTSLPAWAARTQGYTSLGNTNEYALSSGTYGPAVNATYIIGHYLEDYEYLGDLGGVQGIDFDLDEHNGRFCVTPEFPEGVYAYFTSIETDGTPRYPYNIGRSYYGNPTGGAVTTVTEPITIHAEGGPEKPITATIGFDSSDVVLMYDGIESGSYRIETATNLTSGTTDQLVSNLVSTATDDSFTHTNGLQNSGFYMVILDSVVPFDDSGFDSDIPVSGNGGGISDGPVDPSVGSRGTTINITITLDADATPPLPPVNAPIISVTVGSIVASNPVRVDTTTVTATLVIPAGATTGAQNVVVTFIPSYTFTDAFTIE
jgi:hypothetical protein